jgi:lipoprotein-releasing system permease protein
MNGFQKSYIDSIMEISSAHIRYQNADGNSLTREKILEIMLSDPAVVAASPFYEAQTLMTGQGGIERQQAALIRAVPATLTETDAGFAKEAQIRRGAFDLASPNSIVLGSVLAATLGVTTGDTVNLWRCRAVRMLT